MDTPLRGHSERESHPAPARELHHDNAVIEFNLACYASVVSRFEEAKARLGHAIELDAQLRKTPIDDEDLRPLWDWVTELP
ncbi:MAG: hypothetical protein WBL39_12480 [Terrimicrobiaceae bacterium]